MVKSVRKKNQKNNSLYQEVNPILLIGIIVLFLIVGSGIIFLKYKHFNQITYVQPAKSTPSPGQIVPTAPPVNNFTPTPTISYTKEYRSDRLGLSFNYLSKIDYGDAMPSTDYYFTREISDTVYLYSVFNSKTPFTGTDSEFLSNRSNKSFFITRYWKDPNISLTTAIKQQFMKGYSEEYCKISKETITQFGDQEGYITTNIFVAYPPNGGSVEERFNLMMKCPQQFVNDSNHYFIMDPSHSNRFYDVKRADGNIPSGSLGGSWDSSIQIH